MTEKQLIKRLLEDSELKELKEMFMAQKAYDAEPKIPNDLFLRPVLKYDGTTAYTGSIVHTCPDIWIAGIGVETRDDLVSRYNESHDENIELGKNNNIYVRAKNASTRQLTDRIVRLYYCESQYICWPSYWIPIKTDQDLDYAKFGNVGAGEVVAALNSFFWERVPKPSSGEHYCLIAQIDNEKGTLNPRPAEDINRVEFANLLRQTCLWGQRNVNVLNKGDVVCNKSAITTDSPKDREGEYVIMLSTKDCKGLSIEIQCSQKDSKGNDIRLSKTTITDDYGTMAGCDFYLKRDYKAYASTYLYLEGLAPQKEPFVNSRFMVVGADNELDYAVKNQLIDFESSVLAYNLGIRNSATPLIPMGGIKFSVKR